MVHNKSNNNNERMTRFCCAYAQYKILTVLYTCTFHAAIKRDE